MRAVFDILRYALNPIMPWHWRASAKSLSRCVGWEPPMMMIAALGIILPLNVGVGLLGRNEIAATFHLTTSLSWLIVSAVATLIVLGRSVRNLRRYGLAGLTRANWWFECGRLNVILSLFALLCCPIAWFLPARNTTIPALLTGSLICGAAFVVTASIGYASRVVQRFPRPTKAFQCVHYFYCTLVPLGGLITSALFWPQPAFWPDGCLVIAALAVFAVLCLGGIMSIFHHHKQWERSLL